jgi:hypothetical protein
MFDHVDIIHRYTRADALRDGVLIDASATAKSPKAKGRNITKIMEACV